MSATQQKIWVLVEKGLKGTENQCLGIAQKLSTNYAVKHIKLPFLLRLLSPYLNFGLSHYMQKNFTSPYPDIVITAGRKAIGPALWLKKKCNAFTVFVQDPKWRRGAFDLISIPAHDDIQKENIIQTIGSPNLIDNNVLADAKERFSKFELLPPPRIAVLIGGVSKTHDFTPEDAKALADQLKALNGSLMITTSRRTGDEQTKILRDALDHVPHFFWDGEGDNPLHGMMAWANKIIVTADSVSMVSEAASTGVPTYMIPMRGGSAKFTRFYNAVVEANAARWIDQINEPWDNTPLNDTETVADTVLSRYQDYVRKNKANIDK